MAKRKAGSSARKAATRKKKTTPSRGQKKAAAKKTAKRTTGTARTKASSRPAKARRPAASGSTTTAASKTRKKAKKTAPKRAAGASARTSRKAGRARGREFNDTVPSPPSSLDMNRRGSAARTGRAEIAEERADHANMTPAITGGDVDASVEDAYFTGDETPGGDNSTPDQDIVDDIGRALGVEYQDNEELRGSDKVAARDKHRWELDPASAEDYRDRK